MLDPEKLQVTAEALYEVEPLALEAERVPWGSLDPQWKREFEERARRMLQAADVFGRPTALLRDTPVLLSGTSEAPA